MLNNLRQFMPARFTPALRWGAVAVVIAIGVGVVGYQRLWVQPKVISPTAPALGVAEVSNSKPVVIVFSRPVDKKTLKYEIHPALKGRWRVHSSLLTGRSTLTFTPSESPELDTRYTVALDGIRSRFGGQSAKYLLSFQTAPIPIIASVTPADAAVDVLPDASIIVNFDTTVTDGVEISTTVTPEIALEGPKVTDTTVTFTHAVPFQKSTVYTVKIFLATSKLDYATKKRTVGEEKTEISSTTFTTIAAPGIQAYSPIGSDIHPASAVRLEFKQAMDRPSTETALSFSPAVSGLVAWENDQVLTFTPTAPLAKNQPYTVTLAASAKAASGVTADEPFTWQFTTLGAVTSVITPSHGASGVDPATAVSVAFNQAVVPSSAESKFSIQPAVTGSFTWNGRTMVFSPAAPLAYGQSYTVTVSRGVQSVDGLDSAADRTATFTVRNQSVMLKVPAYQQAHVYSCMIAAARSALAFRGITASESSIISRVGRDTTSWSGTWGGDNGVWGDPENAIVGPLDNAAATSPAGKKTTNVYWGYGSHWGPIAKALTSYGVANEIRSGMTVQALAQSITDGNPVIIWWVNGIWPSYAVPWKTPSGKSIRGVNGLHVQVVRGFTGSVDNPVSFTVTDSGYNYPGRTFDVGTFKAKWSWFGNTGIIVK